MNFKNFITLQLVWLFFAASAGAQVQFRASAPSSVAANEPFQVVYELNAQGQNLVPPDFGDFEKLAGPFTSTSSSIQIMNGKQSVSVSEAYTYTLQAQKEGTFTIRPASIVVGGTKYVSNGLSIKVLPANSRPQQQPQQQQNLGGGGSSQQINSNSIFIKPELSKTTVFEQEAVVLTYKLYTTLDLAQCNMTKAPNFEGFMKQDIQLAQNRQANIENYNGRSYAVWDMYQVILFPQKSGVLRIEPAQFDAAVQVQTAARSIFDDMFGASRVVSQKLTAPAVNVTVSALPTANKPASFGNVVGQFNLTSSLSTDKIKTNEAVTLKVVISGAGNMKMLTTPDIKFPQGFEAYDPKVTNDFKTTSSGVSGTKTIEYVFIPRQTGDYEIPPADFSYFDIRSGGYKTLQTNNFKLHVEKGDNSAAPIASVNTSNATAIKQLGNDIRYINTGNIETKPEPVPLFGAVSAWLMYLVPMFLALIFFIIFRKKLKQNADIKFVRNKRANKVAVNRLKSAKKLLAEGKKDAFYEETLKSVWNYLSDKLGISVAELTKDGVNAQLAAKQVDNEQISNLNNLINNCEFARYAPSSGQREMGNLYEDAINIISNLEGKL